MSNLDYFKTSAIAVISSATTFVLLQFFFKKSIEHIYSRKLEKLKANLDLTKGKIKYLNSEFLKKKN